MRPLRQSQGTRGYSRRSGLAVPRQYPKDEIVGHRRAASFPADDRTVFACFQRVVHQIFVVPVPVHLVEYIHKKIAEVLHLEVAASIS